MSKRRSTVYLQKEILKKLQDVHGDSIMLVDNYVNMKTKVLWKHKIYGEWITTPDHVINRGNSHPLRPKRSTKILNRICVECCSISSTSKWHSGPLCHNCYVKKYNKNRANINTILSMRLRKRMWQALKDNVKKTATFDLLGCSIEYLKQHLESKFQASMTWDNYGLKGWHIDHIIPLASFDLRDKTQQMQAFNYMNLQPLWWFDNLSKGSKRDG